MRCAKGSGNFTFIFIAGTLAQVLKSLRILTFGDISCLPQANVTIQMWHPLNDLSQFCSGINISFSEREGC